MVSPETGMPVLLDILDPTQPFPPVEQALTEPDGLLAIGGCLSPKRLLNAYAHGAFPWYEAGQPILWWSPNPRMVLLPERLKVSRSLRKTMAKGVYRSTYNRAFYHVIRACAEPRDSGPDTWLTSDMIAAYSRLHQLGWAHSAEAWIDHELVGGLYGVAIGQVFFGESMFHRATDASKVAFVSLIQRLMVWGYRLIDCQVQTKHLTSLGAEEMPRPEFITRLRQYCQEPPDLNAWRSP